MNSYKEGKKIICGQKVITLKAVKTFEGMEGMGFNANVYIKNKMVGRVSDYGTGGGIHVQFRTPQEVTDLLKKLPTYTDKEWDSKLSFGRDPDHVNRFNEEDIYEYMLQDFLYTKEAKKILKRVAAIDQNGQIMTWKIESKDLEKHRAAIIKNQSKDTLTFLNDLTFEEVKEALA